MVGRHFDSLRISRLRFSFSQIRVVLAMSFLVLLLRLLLLQAVAKYVVLLRQLSTGRPFMDKENETAESAVVDRW